MGNKKRSKTRESQKKIRQRRRQSRDCHQSMLRARREAYQSQSDEVKNARSEARRELYAGEVKRNRDIVFVENHGQPPPIAALSDFEHNASIARNLFWENSGAYRFPSLWNSNNPGEFFVIYDFSFSFKLLLLILQLKLDFVEQLTKEMLEEKVTPEILENCLSSYSRSIGIDTNTSICGCCGEKDFNLNCIPVDIERLQLLQMEEEKLLIYRGLPEPLRAVWTSVHHNGVVYHLHREAFIGHIEDDEDDQSVRYNICLSCRNSLFSNKPTLPIFSLKNGHDYGRLEAIPVQDLSDIEKVAISKGRIFSNVYTIRKAKTGLSVSEGLTGHVISFPQDIPRVFGSEKALPNFESLKSSIQIIFVGSKENAEMIKTDPSIRRNYINLRGDRIAEMLTFFKEVNSCYAHVRLVQDESDLATACTKFTEELLETVEFDDSVTTDRLSKLVSGHDIAQVRNSDFDNTSRLDESLVCPSMPNIGGKLDVFQLKSLANTLDQVKAGKDPEGEHNSEEQLEDESYDLPPIEAKTEKKNTKVYIAREERPFNEFIENDSLLLFSFPHLFLRGQGIKPKKALDSRFTRHLLTQHDGRFAKDSKFMFTLFNQRQRHTLCKETTARIRKGSDGTFKNVLAMINNPDFDQNLQNAIKDPESAESKSLISRLQTMLKLGGMKVPFSPAERASAHSKISSMISHFGKFLLRIGRSLYHFNSITFL